MRRDAKHTSSTRRFSAPARISTTYFNFQFATLAQCISIAAAALAIAHASAEEPRAISDIDSTVSSMPSESTGARLDSFAFPKKLRVRAVMFSRNDLGADNTESGSHDMVSTNRMGLRFRLGEGSSVGLMQEFQYLKVENRKSAGYQMRDTYLQYINNQIAILPGDWDMILRFKGFFPTGEFSRLTGRKGVEVLTLAENRRWRRFEFEFATTGYAYNQSRNTYRNKKNKPVANDDRGLDNYFQTGYYFSEKLQLWHALGLSMKWQRPMPGRGETHDSILANETGLTYHPNKPVYLSLSFCNEPEMGRNNSVYFYRDSDSVYRLTFDIKI